MSDPADTYSIPGTDVLKNLLGLRDAATLADVERDLVELRDVALKRAPLVGKYDFAHLCAFHRWLFQDIYAWAGKPRTVDITKDQALFCRAALIEAQAPAIFTALEQEPPLSKDPTLAADRLAYHLGEVNALHPFERGTVEPSGRSCGNSRSRVDGTSTGPVSTLTRTLPRVGQP